MIENEKDNKALELMNEYIKLKDLLREVPLTENIEHYGKVLKSRQIIYDKIRKIIDDIASEHNKWEDELWAKSILNVRNQKIEDRLHPEKKEDEYFLINIYEDSDEYDDIGWKTKRIGRISYDEFGNQIDEMVPVFIKKEEYEKFKDKIKNYEREEDRVI